MIENMMTDRDAPAVSDLRQLRRDRKTAEIVAAAWELSRRDGLAGLSLRVLADRVELRQPSLYAYFESKLDLYDAMFADGNRQLLEAMRRRTALSDPREELIAFTEACVQFSSDDVVRHQLLFQRTIPGFEPSEASFAVALEFYTYGMQRLRAAGVTKQGDVDIYTALVSGLGHQQIANDPGGDRFAHLLPRAVDMWADGVGLPRSTTPEKDPA